MIPSSSAAPLEARCHLNSADVAALRRTASLHAQTRPQNSINGLVFLVLSIAPVYFLYAPLFSPKMRAPGMTGWPGVLSMAIPLLIFALALFYLALALMRARKSQGDFSKSIHITLDAAGSTGRTETSVHTVQWRGLLLVVATKDHLFLFTERSEGFIVPRRAFANKADWKTFTDFALKQWQSERPIAPPITDA